MIRRKSPKANLERAASMLEFVIAIPSIFLMIMLLVDAGIFLYHYSLMTDATSVATRALATTVAQRVACTGCGAPATCSDLEAAAKNSICALKSSRTALYSGTNFTIDIAAHGTVVPYQFITVNGTFEFSCFFCNFLPTSEINYSSVLTIERQNTGCVGPINYTVTCP